MPLEQAEGSLALLDREAEQQNRARLCRVIKRLTDFKKTIHTKTDRNVAAGVGLTAWVQQGCTIPFLQAKGEL